MSQSVILLLIAVLGPAVAFGAAFLLFRALRLSGSPRGAQLIALGVAGAIQGGLLAASIATNGFGSQTILLLVVSTIFTALGWARFRRVFPGLSGKRPTSV